MLRLLPVESSSIKAVGYAEGTLYIQFTSGSVYCYKDVPADMFVKLINADSVGHFFAAEIKPHFTDYDYLK